MTTTTVLSTATCGVLVRTALCPACGNNYIHSHKPQIAFGSLIVFSFAFDCGAFGSGSGTATNIDVTLDAVVVTFNDYRKQV